MTAHVERDLSPPAQTPEAGKSRLRRSAPILIPAMVLIAWFGYLWAVSGVLDYEEHYPGGQVKVRGFVRRVGIGNYARHGEWVEYHENGRKSAQGAYQAGERVGVWTHWDQDGKVVSRREPLDERTGPDSAPTLGNP